MLVRVKVAVSPPRPGWSAWNSRSSCRSDRGRRRTAAWPSCARTSGSRRRRPSGNGTANGSTLVPRPRGLRLLGSKPGIAGRGSWAMSAGKGHRQAARGRDLAGQDLGDRRPPRWPGYQACSTAPTFDSQGIRIGLPVSSTTAVRGLAAPTAAIRASWPSGQVRGDGVHPPPPPPAWRRRWRRPRPWPGRGGARRVAAVVELDIGIGPQGLQRLQRRGQAVDRGQEGGQTPRGPAGPGCGRRRASLAMSRRPTARPCRRSRQSRRSSGRWPARGRTPSFFSSTMPCRCHPLGDRRSGRSLSMVPPGLAGLSIAPTA